MISYEKKEDSGIRRCESHGTAKREGTEGEMGRSRVPAQDAGVGQNGRASEGKRQKATKERRLLMAVYKRGKIWWYKFNWNGEPIRRARSNPTSG
jgi:hypothetical protein